MQNVIERFMEKVVKTTDCWIYATQRGRYAYVQLNGKPVGAHRAAYTLFKGEIPPGMCILHSCDNPHCVNPDHLSLGTQQDNMSDMQSKGRTCSPLTAEQAQEIKNTPLSYGSGIALAKKFGITPAAVSSIRSGKSWSHLQAETA